MLRNEGLLEHGGSLAYTLTVMELNSRHTDHKASRVCNSHHLGLAERESEPGLQSAGPALPEQEETLGQREACASRPTPAKGPPGSSITRARPSPFPTSNPVRASLDGPPLPSRPVTC